MEEKEQMAKQIKRMKAELDDAYAEIERLNDINEMLDEELCSVRDELDLIYEELEDEREKNRK